MRLAFPSGRLFDELSSLFRLGGFGLEHAKRGYHVDCNMVGVDVARLVKPRAIPQLLALGRFQAGFCGRDLIENADVRDEGVEILDLGLNPVSVMVAVPKAVANILDRPPTRPILIATEYENLAHGWAFERGLAHIVIQTYGSTEGFAPDDADVVIDCVETGNTMTANSLVIVETLMESSTCLFANRQWWDENHTSHEGARHLFRLFTRG